MASSRLRRLLRTAGRTVWRSVVQYCMASAVTWGADPAYLRYGVQGAEPPAGADPAYLRYGVTGAEPLATDLDHAPLPAPPESPESPAPLSVTERRSWTDLVQRLQ